MHSVIVGKAFSELLPVKLACNPGFLTRLSYQLGSFCVCRDLLKFIKAHNLTPVPQAVVSPPPSPPIVSGSPGAVKQPDAPKPNTTKLAVAKGADFVDVELSNMRAVIAKRLTAAKVKC